MENENNDAEHKVSIGSEEDTGATGARSRQATVDEEVSVGQSPTVVEVVALPAYTANIDAPSPGHYNDPVNQKIRSEAGEIPVSVVAGVADGIPMRPDSAAFTPEQLRQLQQLQLLQMQQIQQMHMGQQAHNAQVLQPDQAQLQQIQFQLQQLQTQVQQPQLLQQLQLQLQQLQNQLNQNQPQTPMSPVGVITSPKTAPEIPAISPQSPGYFTNEPASAPINGAAQSSPMPLTDTDKEADNHALDHGTANFEDEEIKMAVTSNEASDLKYAKASYNFISLTLTILSLTSLLLMILYGSVFYEYDQAHIWLIVFAVSTSLYGLEALIIPFCTESTLKFLFNKLHGGPNSSEHAYFVNIRNTAPELWMHIECYHYETRTRTVYHTHRDSNGNTTRQPRTETYTEKVVTYRESKQKQFGSWIDNSGVAPKLVDIDQSKFGILVRLRQTVEFDTPETANFMQQQANNFRSQNMNRDTHYSFTESLKREDFKSALFLVDKDRMPRLVGPGWYVLSTLLFCAWPYRFALRHGVLETKYQICSKVSMHQDAFPNDDIVEAVAVET